MEKKIKIRKNKQKAHPDAMDICSTATAPLI